MFAGLQRSGLPLPDGDGHEFVWPGEVIGVMRWGDATADVAAGWWFASPTGESSLVWRSAGDADPARVRIKHEPAACWFAHALLASAIADGSESDVVEHDVRS